MSPNENQLLIDHLDQTLNGPALEAVEELLQKDPEAASEWKILQFTVANIREAGLFEQVTGVRNQYMASKASQPRSRKAGVVRTMTQTMMRVAAVLILISASAFLYKYLSVDSRQFYNEYYGLYELSTSRGSGDDDRLESAYQEKKWSEVVSIVNGIPEKTSKHLFLAGIALLELKQYPQGIDQFEAVKTMNLRKADKYFDDEADYYLAMGYLANNESYKAFPILETIKKDKNHQFHSVVNKMGIDYQMLKLRTPEKK